MHKFLLGVGGGGAQFSFFFSFSVVEMKMGMKIATAIATTATIKHIPLSIWINSISVYENSNPKKGNYLFSQRRYMLTQIYI